MARQPGSKRTLVLRFVTAGLNALLFAAVFLVNYAGGETLFQLNRLFQALGTYMGYVGAGYTANFENSLSLISLLAMVLIILPGICAVLWAIPRLHGTLPYTLQTIHALCAIGVSVFLAVGVFGSGGSSRSVFGLLMEYLRGQGGGWQVLNLGFYALPLLAIAAMVTGGLAMRGTRHTLRGFVPGGIRVPESPTGPVAAAPSYLAGALALAGRTFPVFPGIPLAVGSKQTGGAQLAGVADVDALHCTVSLSPEGGYLVQGHSPRGVWAGQQYVGPGESAHAPKGAPLYVGNAQNLLYLN